MIRTYHNHTLQTNLRHREEEPQSTIFHELKVSNQLSLSHQEDGKLERTLSNV